MRREQANPELVLKATPPRLGKGLLSRQGLRMEAAAFADKAVIAVQATAGFGKTSLLGQWRRESLLRAALVAWLTLDERDEPTRFVQGLVVATRLGSGRGEFGEVIRCSSAPSSVISSSPVVSRSRRPTEANDGRRRRKRGGNRS